MRNSVISNKKLNNIPQNQNDINKQLGLSKLSKKIYKINKILPRKEILIKAQLKRKLRSNKSLSEGGCNIHSLSDFDESLSQASSKYEQSENEDELLRKRYYNLRQDVLKHMMMTQKALNAINQLFQNKTQQKYIEISSKTTHQKRQSAVNRKNKKTKQYSKSLSCKTDKIFGLNMTAFKHLIKTDQDTESFKSQNTQVNGATQDQLKKPSNLKIQNFTDRWPQQQQIHSFRQNNNQHLQMQMLLGSGNKSLEHSDLLSGREYSIRDSIDTIFEQENKDIFLAASQMDFDYFSEH